MANNLLLSIVCLLLLKGRLIVGVLWRKWHFRFLSLCEETIKDDIVVILRNETAQPVMLL
jgi:hypothetical protein